MDPHHEIDGHLYVYVVSLKKGSARGKGDQRGEHLWVGMGRVMTQRGTSSDFEIHTMKWRQLCEKDRKYIEGMLSVKQRVDVTAGEHLTYDTITDSLAAYRRRHLLRALALSPK